MALDIALAAALCLSALVMAYLGVHVTLHPTEDWHKQRKYRAAFLVLGVIVLAITIVQTVRNAKTQAAIRKQLADIERNTKQPPTVQTTINVPPPQVILPDNSKEKANRAAVRVRLGKALTEANNLRNECSFVAPDTPDKGVRWHAWSSGVEHYLAKNLGSDYVARFKASENFSMNCWAGIGEQMNMLNEFIRDFQ
jgi:hypothetical protein